MHCEVSFAVLVEEDVDRNQSLHNIAECVKEAADECGAMLA
jgi:hypothetical protein